MTPRQLVVRVSTCRVCDAGRGPLKVPEVHRGHNPRTHELVVAVPVAASMAAR